MKRLTILILSGLMSLQCLAINIIVHPSNADALDDQSISRIFLGKAKTFPGGSQAVPINLDEGTAGAEEFNTKVLNRSASQLKAYWSKLVFTGKGQPPKAVANDAEMIALIASNPNMIGYIEGDADDSVKVVASF